MRSRSPRRSRRRGSAASKCARSWSSRRRHSAECAVRSAECGVRSAQCTVLRAEGGELEAESWKLRADVSDYARETVEAVYRSDSRRVLATLIRLLGDFDLAEEAMHDAFAAAVEQWPREGVPANPRAWLVSTGRFKAIDRTRRGARFDRSLGELAERLEAEARAVPDLLADAEAVEDDRLRLIFTCCHPA